MANKQIELRLSQLLTVQGSLDDADSNMVNARRIMTNVMKNMVKNMIESAEDDIPLSSLKIQKKKTIKPIIERDIIETKYDIVEIVEDVDDISDDISDDVVKVKSMTSDVFYTINLTNKTCECLDFKHRSKVNPEHKCKHLKKYFENMSDVDVN
jgi:hypothetical protein